MHGSGVQVLPAGQRDGDLGAGGGEEREGEEVAVATLLDDSEEALQAFELNDGAGGLTGRGLQSGEFGGGDGEGVEQGEAFCEEAHALLQAGGGCEERRDFGADEVAESGLCGENSDQVEDQGGACVGTEEDVAEEDDCGQGRDEKGGAEEGGEGGWGGGEPIVDEGGGDALEVADAEEGDALAEVGLGGELADGLLAGDGFSMGCGVEEVGGEAALAEGGADSREEAEERVGAEEIEVAGVEVVGGRGRAVVAGLRLCAVGAGDGGGVEGKEAVLRIECGLQGEVAADEKDEERGGGGEGGGHQQVVAGEGGGQEGEEEEGEERRGEDLQDAGAARKQGGVSGEVFGVQAGVGGEGVLLFGGIAGLGHFAMVDWNLCRVLRDVIPPTPPGPEGSNGNGLVWAQ